MKRTSGTWDAKAPFCYFVAGPVNFIENVKGQHKNVLVAVNELGDDWRPTLTRLSDDKFSILLDSGAFAVASEHSRKHEISLDEAFRLPLAQLDGFLDLKKQYLNISESMQDKLWGIVEIDLGGEKQKLETRSEIEKSGFIPIPVYHPFGDSLSYFEFLVTEYDRVCVGNLVQASRYARKRIYQHMVKVLSRLFPDGGGPWVHLLGVTPSELNCAYFFQSCDSSAWLNVVRWSGYVEKACLRSVGHLHKNFQYELGDKDSWQRGIKMGAMGANFQEANLRLFSEDMASL